MIVSILNVPKILPRCAVDGPYLMAWRLRLRVGAEEIEIRVPPDVEAMYWLADVLREGADRMRVAAEELSRQIQEEERNNE